jgi:hypothetical protein
MGPSGSLRLSPKFSAYLVFAASTSSRILVITLASCSKLSQRVGYREIKHGAEAAASSDELFAQFDRQDRAQDPTDCKDE